jgi:hypothetical protein
VVRKAITRTIITLPEQIRQSLTWDQGAEMAQHSDLRIDTGLQIYFCDPHTHGSAAPMRIPTACFANTFQRGLISLHIVPATSRRWRGPLIQGRAKPLDGRPPPRPWINIFEELNATLRPPFESAQYTSLAFGQRCEEAGVRPSMGSVGDCFDNAMCESFMKPLKCDHVYMNEISQ